MSHLIQIREGDPEKVITELSESLVLIDVKVFFPKIVI